MRSELKLEHAESLEKLHQQRGTTRDDTETRGQVQKVVLVIVSVVCIFLATGVIFGISALEDHICSSQGAFAIYCQDGEALPCPAQRGKFAMAVTVAMTAFGLSALPSGVFLDWAGPKATACTASAIFAAGLLCFAAAPLSWDLLYVLGLVALATAGPALFASVTNFADLFPLYSSAILSAQSGALQVSSIVMAALHYAIVHSGLSFTTIFSLYLVVPVFIFTASLFLFPNTAFGAEQSPGHRGEPHRLWLLRSISRQQTADLKSTVDNVKESHVLSASNSSADHTTVTVFAQPEHCVKEQEAPLLRKGNTGVAEPPSVFNIELREQLLSVPFLLGSVFLGVAVLLVNFFIATVHDQLTKERLWLGDSPSQAADYAAFYTTVFNYTMGVGAVVGIPCGGYMLVKVGLPISIFAQGASYFLYFATSTVMGLPGIVKVFGYLALGVYRFFSFAIFSAFLAEIFGFRNFGRLYGIANVMSVLILTVQYLYLYLLNNAFHGSYLPINIICAVLTSLCSLSLPFYLVYGLYSGYWVKPQPKSLQSHVHDFSG